MLEQVDLNQCFSWTTTGNSKISYRTFRDILRIANGEEDVTL